MLNKRNTLFRVVLLLASCWMAYMVSAKPFVVSAAVSCSCTYCNSLAQGYSDGCRQNCFNECQNTTDGPACANRTNALERACYSGNAPAALTSDFEDCQANEPAGTDCCSQAAADYYNEECAGG